MRYRELGGQVRDGCAVECEARLGVRELNVDEGKRRNCRGGVGHNIGWFLVGPRAGHEGDRHIARRCELAREPEPEGARLLFKEERTLRVVERDGAEPRPAEAELGAEVCNRIRIEIVARNLCLRKGDIDPFAAIDCIDIDSAQVGRVDKVACRALDAALERPGGSLVAAAVLPALPGSIRGKPLEREHARLVADQICQCDIAKADDARVAQPGVVSLVGLVLARIIYAIGTVVVDAVLVQLLNRRRQQDARHWVLGQSDWNRRAVEG